MTPSDPRAEQSRLKQLRNAMALFESNPEYPSTVVQMSDQSAALTKSMSDEAKHPGTAARMQHIVKLFDISAQAFLRLVSNLETQNAFLVVLNGFMREAWESYIGYPFDIVPPIGRVALPIQERVKHWAIEGYRHLESLRQAASNNQPTVVATSTSTEALAIKRQAFIMPVLDRLGMSKSKWATKAGEPQGARRGY